MTPTRLVLAAAIASVTALSLSACSHGGELGHSGAVPSSSATTASIAATGTTSAMPASTAAPAAMAASGGSAAAAPAASVAKYVASNQQSNRNWFGGPIYNGKPDLKATAALVKAGGGAENFSFSKALDSMLGEKTVNAEVAKLTRQYGKQNVDDFINGMTFVVKDGLKRAAENGVKLPSAPANLHGAKLAKGLVQAGTAPDGTFWSGYLFDHALSHPVHDQVMADVDAKDSQAADAKVHKILNQAMYDIAQALGQKNVKLASFH